MMRKRRLAARRRCIYNKAVAGDDLFVWDEAKRASNLAVHGIDFFVAADFEWSTAQIGPDTRRDYGEARFIALGLIGPRVHVLVFTERENRIRIISLRKANTREIARYEKG